MAFYAQPDGQTRCFAPVAFLATFSTATGFVYSGFPPGAGRLLRFLFGDVPT